MLLNGPNPASFLLFSKQILQKNCRLHLDWTRIVGVEGKHADHLTTPRPFANVLFLLPVWVTTCRSVFLYFFIGYSSLCLALFEVVFCIVVSYSSSSSILHRIIFCKTVHLLLFWMPSEAIARCLYTTPYPINGAGSIPCILLVIFLCCPFVNFVHWNSFTCPLLVCLPSFVRSCPFFIFCKLRKNIFRILSFPPFSY